MEQWRGVLATAGNTGYGTDDDTAGFDKTVFQQGGQCQRCTGRVAAGIGNQIRSLDFVPEQFRQAIGGISQVIGVGVGLVKGLIERDIFDPVVSAEVDDLDTGGQQFGHKSHGYLMRQTAQGNIGF